MLGSKPKIFAISHFFKIVTVSTPYPDIASNKDVARFVLGGGRLESPTDCPTELCKLMQSMWAENPEERPTFKTVLNELQQLEPDEEESEYATTVQLGIHDGTDTGYQGLKTREPELYN
jgi:hypothetical protein